MKPVDVASMDLAPNVMPMPDDSRYNFEQGEQDWHDLNRTAGTPPRRTTMRAFRGVGSLEVGLDLAAGADGRYVGVVPPSVMPGAGATITFRLWLPAGHKLIYVQPFILYFPTGARSSVWEGDSRPTAALPVESWFPLTVAVPATTDRIIQLGVHFKSIDGWRGTVWIDSVTW